MGPKVLVEKNIIDGENLINDLKKNLTLKDALWVYDEDDNFWKLIITSPSSKNEGTKHVYAAIDKILRKQESPLLFSYIQVLDTNDNLIKMFRSAYDVRKRFFGNVLVDDVYVYVLNGKKLSDLKHAS